VRAPTPDKCCNDFSGDSTPAITVEYPAGGLTVGILASAFTGVTLNSEIVTPTGTTPWAGYTVASLKDHLDYDLTARARNITVTIECGNRKNAGLLVRKSEDGANLFDMRVPPTNPGFIVPEIAIGSIMAVSTMIGALGLYTYKKKHTPIK
jgi:hypothetical protein